MSGDRLGGVWLLPLGLGLAVWALSGGACVVSPRPPGPPSLYCCNSDSDCLDGYACVANACLVPCLDAGPCDTGGECLTLDVGSGALGTYCGSIDFDYGSGDPGTGDCVPFLDGGGGSGGFGGFAGAGGFGGFGGF